MLVSGGYTYRQIGEKRTEGELEAVAHKSRLLIRDKLKLLK